MTTGKCGCGYGAPDSIETQPTTALFGNAAAAALLFLTGCLTAIWSGIDVQGLPAWQPQRNTLQGTLPMNLAPDREQMRRAIDVLHPPAAVIEFRALHQKGRKYTTAGYFDAEHREQLIDEAIRLNSQGAAVYVVMNPLDPQLLARHANRTQDYASATATDSNVLRRHWLLIDVDPQRPRDTSATGNSWKRRKNGPEGSTRYLTDQGWPKPISAESGNGFHLLFRVDLPNDDPAAT